MDGLPDINTMLNAVNVAIGAFSALLTYIGVRACYYYRKTKRGGGTGC